MKFSKPGDKEALIINEKNPLCFTLEYTTPDYGWVSVDCRGDRPELIGTHYQGVVYNFDYQGDKVNVIGRDGYLIEVSNNRQNVKDLHKTKLPDILSKASAILTREKAHPLVAALLQKVEQYAAHSQDSTPPSLEGWLAVSAAPTISKGAAPSSP